MKKTPTKKLNPSKPDGISLKEAGEIASFFCGGGKPTKTTKNPAKSKRGPWGKAFAEFERKLKLTLAGEERFSWCSVKVPHLDDCCLAAEMPMFETEVLELYFELNDSCDRVFAKLKKSELVAGPAQDAKIAGMLVKLKKLMAQRFGSDIDILYK